MILDDDPQWAERGRLLHELRLLPVLQQHIGIARVRPDLAAAGTDLRLELAVNHHNTTVRVTTTSMPFFDPERKKS